jgi:hypothetical protein
LEPAIGWRRATPGNAFPRRCLVQFRLVARRKTIGFQSRHSGPGCRAAPGRKAKIDPCYRPGGENLTLHRGPTSRWIPFRRTRHRSASWGHKNRCSRRVQFGRGPERIRESGLGDEAANGVQDAAEIRQRRCARPGKPSRWRRPSRFCRVHKKGTNGRQIRPKLLCST